MEPDKNPSKRPPPPTILEWFRSRLKEREQLGPVTTLEIVRIYEEVLVELMSNSKPVITELSIIADEQKKHAEGIARAICDRIIKVPMEQKLPSLYLLDSIVKNVGREYLRYFAARLPEVFLETYKKVNPNLHPAMLRLFKTWPPYFPSSVLSNIEVSLQGNQNPASSGDLGHSGSQSPHLLHDIHVNSKYLEAHHLSEHSAVDTHHTQVPLSLQSYRQNSSCKNSEYDLDHNEALPPRPDFGRIATAVMGGVEDMLPHPRPSSPPRIGQKLKFDTFSEKFIDRPSLSGFGSFRPSNSNGALARSWPSGDGAQNPNDSGAYKNNNGCDKLRARLLIDAYGSKDASHENLPKIQRLDFNGISCDFKDPWSSEEEHVWESMSPTLASQSKGSDPAPFGHNTGLTRLNAAYLRKDFGGDWHNQAFLPRSDDPADVIENPGCRTFSDTFHDDVASHKEPMRQYQNSCHAQEPLKFSNVLSQSSQHTTAPRSQGKLLRIPNSSSEIAPTVAHKKSSSFDDACQADVPFGRISSSHSDTFKGETSTIKRLAQEAYLPDATSVLWPPVHKSQPLLLPSHQQFISSFDLESSKPTVDARSNQPLFLPRQQFDADDRTKVNSTRSHLNLERLQQATNLPIESQEAEGRSAPLAPVPVSSHLVPQASCHAQAQGAVISPNLPNLPSGITPPNPLPLQPSLYTFRPLHPPSLHPSPAPAPPPPPVASAAAPSHPVIAPHPAPPHSFNPAPPHPPLTTSSHLLPFILPPVVTPNNSLTFYPPSGPLPPLPPGPPPASLQIRPATQSISPVISESPASAYTGLISSLMAQGFISLVPPNPSQESVGIDFNAELLKVRHDSSINALYGDLSRQCTTCGMRFRSQEEHSSHMDWHVTKNRRAKNQKQKPSRNWYVTAKEWLSGAEALGADVLPGIFLTEPVVDKKEDKEVTVPADEDQSTCALCGEPFKDFYSDEMEEWLYRGAVYLNAPNGSLEGIERSKLGPIVHAKCLPESADCFGKT